MNRAESGCAPAHRPLRIAMIGLRAVGEACSGGIETHVDALAPRLAALGHRVTVFCRSPYARDLPREYKGATLRPLPCVRTKHLETVTHSFLASLAALRGFDVVHYHAVGPSLFSWLPRIAGARVVATVHGLDNRRAKWGAVARTALGLGVRAAVLFPHATIVVSPTLRDFYDRRFGAATHFIPNGVNAPAAGTGSGTGPDDSGMNPVHRLSRFGVTEPGYTLFLGRLVPEKGAHDLIAAYRRVVTARPLVIAGGASHTSDYEQSLRAAAAGDERILFTGPLYGPDKDAAYANAGLFVLPSTVEGMPITLLEASAHGAPSLVSDIPETTSVFERARCALAGVFRAGDAQSLEEELARLLDAGDEGAAGGGKAVKDRAAVGERARKWVLEHHDWDRIAVQVQDVYQMVWQRGRSSAEKART